MAVIPNTPSAWNVFRSAWMPAPPPESDPAIESARGIPLPSGKVIPPRWLEGFSCAVGADRHKPVIRDFPNEGEWSTEAVPESLLSGAHRLRGQARQQLVV